MLSPESRYYDHDYSSSENVTALLVNVLFLVENPLLDSLIRLYNLKLYNPDCTVVHVLGHDRGIREVIFKFVRGE